jgi:hypothetical protein
MPAPYSWYNGASSLGQVQRKPPEMLPPRQSLPIASRQTVAAHPVDTPIAIARRIRIRALGDRVEAASSVGIGASDRSAMC